MAKGEAINQWLAGIIIAVAGSALTYLLAIRKASGRIETTEASDLWGEAALIRKELREETSALRELVTRLRERIAVLERENDHLRAENAALLERVARIEGT